MQDQTESRLMKLPAELRNRIYELALPSTTITPADRSQTTISTKSPAPGFLLTCKQVYNEAIGLYYSTTSFWFTTADHFIQWAQALFAEKLCLIKDVILIAACPTDENLSYMIRVVDFDSLRTRTYVAVRDPVAALKHAGACAARTLEDVTERVALKEGVVKAALQITRVWRYKEMWWTTEPESVVDEVIAEADQKTLKEIGQEIDAQRFFLPDDG